jgi:hypothetical protein
MTVNIDLLETDLLRFVMKQLVERFGEQGEKALEELVHRYQNQGSTSKGARRSEKPKSISPSSRKETKKFDIEK